jgi:4-hydroxy-tetrahydrodipicolinate reductase
LIRVAVAGALGRMGREVARLAEEAPDLALSGMWDARGAADLGAALAGADVVVDFTSPEGTLAVAAAAADRAVPLVSGTTGLPPEARAVLAQIAARIPILHAPNMSAGVAVLADLVTEAVRRLGDSFDVEIVEMHHRHKVDAPSGTALRLADAVSAARPGIERVHGRSGAAGPRGPGEVAILALRGGDVVGDHTVILAGPGERIELTHRASSRETFAQGALRAARWIIGRPPGLYGMADVLGR